MIVHESNTTAISDLASPQSSPLVLSTASLPYHWQLVRSCERSTWRDVPLPAGDFSSLDSILQSDGCSNAGSKTARKCKVELVPNIEVPAPQTAPLASWACVIVALTKQGQFCPVATKELRFAFAVLP